MGSSSISLSGMSAATTRMRNSAHNVANLQTEGFRNHRTHQVSSHGGGVRASTRVDSEPQPVDYAHEVVEQVRARTDFRANLRTLKTELKMRGDLLDILA